MVENIFPFHNKIFTIQFLYFIHSIIPFMIYYLLPSSPLGFTIFFRPRDPLRILHICLKRYPLPELYVEH